MITDLDTDGSGAIDFSEWLTLMTKRVSDKDTRANINKIFYLYDDEKTGFISAKNLRRIAQELGENISEEEINELIHRADVDQDGIVSEEEFYTIITRKIKDWYSIGLSLNYSLNIKINIYLWSFKPKTVEILIKHQSKVSLVRILVKLNLQEIYPKDSATHLVLDKNRD